MSGLWLVSYVVLWVIVAVMALLLLGALRQIGALRLETGQIPVLADDDIPTVQDDGPPIGSHLPELSRQAVNGHPDVNGQGSGAATLLVFMSPMCDSCQHVVDPINQVLEERGNRLRATVLLRSDDQACRAFLSVFPLAAQVICDSNHDLTGALGVHRNPFGLLYDEQGTLVRKGVMKNLDELLALVGDPAASPEARSAVFPPLEPTAPEPTLATTSRT